MRWYHHHHIVLNNACLQTRVPACPAAKTLSPDASARLQAPPDAPLSCHAHLQNRLVMPSSTVLAGWAAAGPGTGLAQLMQSRAPQGRKGC